MIAVLRQMPRYSSNTKTGLTSFTTYGSSSTILITGPGAGKLKVL